MQTQLSGRDNTTMSTQPSDSAAVALSSPMRVKKRDGTLEEVDVNRIVARVRRCSQGLNRVDPLRVATKTIGGLYDGATTQELDNLSIQTAALLISEEPQYSGLAAGLLAAYIEEEVQSQGIHTFSDAIARGFNEGLIAPDTLAFVEEHRDVLNATLDNERSRQFRYFGLRTLYDRYLLKHPTSRLVVETPQIFFMRVACGLARDLQDALDYYKLFSRFEYIPSSPTLFNSATRHPQLSSCFLVDSPQDNLESIYSRYTQIAKLSKFGGGIGMAYHRVRAQGSLIRGTNGHSNGIVPWLKTLDSSVAAVNQGGRRKGACCVYLEPWHADIEDFLELRDNTGDDARRTHNLNLSNWICDLFMQRVERGEMWSLFDPAIVPELPDLYGAAFEAKYLEAEAKGLAKRQVNARDLYGRMMKTLAQTGNGWMTFKDASNKKCNQTGEDGNVVHLSNLCTEIIEVTNDDHTAVCNLGSVNLSRHLLDDGAFDFDKLGDTVRTAVRQLDRVIDINFYPIDQAKGSNALWRPVGLGLMGLQDVFFTQRIAFDSPEAKALSTRIQEEIYFHALTASADLAEKYGAHENFKMTRAAKGELQFDLWGVTPTDPARWDALRTRIQEVGLRNSLMIAIAPTATIASIMGCYECIEPQVSNLFKRETLSGEFLQLNRYLVRDLQDAGLWTEEVRQQIVLGEGSIQHIDAIPQALRTLYRTAWELPMKALIDMAAARGAYIDQSQSLNLFMESPTIGKVSSMYMYAWKTGLKTTYYLRSRPATRIAKTTVTAGQARPVNGPVSGSTGGSGFAFAQAKQAIKIDLENPEYCDGCQ